MSFQSKDGKKYGSAYVAKRKDREHGEPESNEEATPKHHGEDEVNSFSKSENKPDKHEVHEKEPVEHDEQEHNEVEPEVDHEEEHRDDPPEHLHFEHNHDTGEHKLHAHYSDGSEAHTEHPSASLAYEAGGTLQNYNMKKLNPNEGQQGAASEGDKKPKINPFEAPDLV